ncbi:TolB family protein [Salinibacter sp.]|uniref:TolB family protein n=1 Tax=Salinibacter sp. TaxID=2065818 RepID=UPI0021E72739|nr:hypothetical protein [Salinibacter sp.]
MRRFLLPILASTVVGAVVIAAACSTPTEPKKKEPTFAPGEYGGEPLPGTEHVQELFPSPSGDRIALIRKRTPDESSDPRNQLWIVDRDGTNPRLIGVNILGADWHPTEDRLAVTVAVGIDFYVYTIDLETMETKQWTGKNHQRLSFPVVSSSGWFEDGHRLLVFAHQKAYQQPFPRGLYIVDTSDSTTIGPLAELFESASFGKNHEYAIGKKYLRDNSPPSGNFARYNFADSTWQWITDFPEDSLDLVDTPVACPGTNYIFQAREVQNAKQLFIMESRGENARQITTLGGDIPRCGSNGSYFIFRRDVNQGQGARYVPFRFELETMEAEPLWPTLPDSVPDFPPLSSQSLSKTLNPR